MASSISISPATRTNNIHYAVRDIVVLANEVARSGKRMLWLNIGDPNAYDFETPPHLVEAIYKALKDNKNGYAPSSGVPEAVEAVRKEAHRKGIQNIQDIFITTGASEAIEICLTALANEGDNVLTPSPGYPLYTAVLSKLGVEENPYYLDEEDNWQPNIDDIASKVNDRTRAIVLINPNNPTGSNCSRELLINLINLAETHNLVIFADEIYDKLLFDERQHISIASLDKDVPVITFSGMAKNFLGPGLRIGWGVISGDHEILKDYIEAINKILRARLCANHPIQFAVKPALEGDQSHIKDMIARLTLRRDLSMKMLNSIDGISCVTPRGAFYAFPKLEIEGSDEDFVKQLIRETGVVVVPGTGFGQVPGSSHFRIVFLPPESILSEAFEKIGQFMKKYR